MAFFCVVVIRGGKKPFVVDVISKQLDVVDVEAAPA
jgi:hypothetical protein